LDIQSIGYQFPCPVAISPIQDPIDPRSVDPATVSGLEAVGFSTDRKIDTELTSPTSTSAKLFCHVAKLTTLKIEDYPWPDEVADTAADEIFLRSPKELDDRPAPTDDLGRQKRPAMDVSPPEDASIPRRAESPQTSNQAAPDPFVITNITLRIEDVLGRIQEVLRAASVQWFHPTPDQSVAGIVQKEFFVTIQARITVAKTVEIIMARRSGEDSLMLTLCKRIERALKDDG
jgi:hypothetical protein